MWRILKRTKTIEASCLLKDQVGAFVKARENRSTAVAQARLERRVLIARGSLRYGSISGMCCAASLMGRGFASHGELSAWLSCGSLHRASSRAASPRLSEWPLGGGA
jgi:hypothetical protein